MNFKRTFTDHVPARREATFKKLAVATYHGVGRFISPDRFVVDAKELAAKCFVIASGARPAPLGIPGEAHVKTSTDFLELDALPRRVALIGAGYIAFEFAHLAARGGAEVVILGRGRPLKHFDAQLVAALVEHTRSLKVDVRLDSAVEAVEKVGGKFRVHFCVSAGAAAVSVDMVIHAAGRIPKTSELDLARASVDTDARGAVKVDEHLQSVTNPAVYAAGDAVSSAGALPLTPVAAHQGAIVASNILHGSKKTPDYRGIPSVVFTTPPLASVGLTEEEAKAKGLNVRVKSEYTREWFSSRRVLAGASIYKTLIEQESDRVVGAHLLGPNADEIVNLFALAIRHGIKAQELAHSIYAYPTNASDLPYML